MLKAQGTKGKLLAGGRVAAVLGSWTLESVPLTGNCRIMATVTERDEYWCDATDRFTVLLLLGVKSWRWVNASVAFSDDTAIITTKGRPTE
jgi:hypothetical protein